MAKVLIIDDNASIRTNLGEILTDEGYEALEVSDGEKGLVSVEKDDIDIVLLDVLLPGIDGLEVLKRIKDTDPEIEVILISGHGTIEKAVQAMKRGAYDFLEKPLSMDRVLITVDHALEKRSFNKERSEWLHRQDKQYQMIGESLQMKKIWDDIKCVASTNSRVIITGESGTGKELVSYWIHQFSSRKGKPFIKVNCAAIPNELIESELFGFEKGAFTGAYQRKIGKFEMADKGTIFLDEIGDMDQHTQAKVLRVLEDGEFQRIGGLSSIKVDLRVIAATNKNITEEIKKGNFRADLYHRINVFQIYLPPLRERRIDIPLLANHFLKEYCFENGFHLKRLNKGAESYLSTLYFSGNIRELRNIIERAVIICKKEEITIDSLHIGNGISAVSEEDIFTEPKNLGVAKNDMEKRFIRTQLALNQWNVSKTAEKLGVHRSNLSRRIRQLGIKKE